MISPKTYSPSPYLIELLEGEQKLIPPVPVGSNLNSRDWEQESVLRMLLNHSELSVSQYFGKLPAYEYEDTVNWNVLKDNISQLLKLENDETLLINSGKPAGVFKTGEKSPRVLMINSSSDEPENLEEDSYRHYSQMLRESWTSTGIQDILDDHYHVFSNIATDYFQGSLEGKLAVTAGLGHTGAAQTLGITMNRGSAVVIELNRKLAEKMIDDGYCSQLYEDIDSAFDVAADMKRNGQARSIVLVGNSAEIFRELVNKGVVPNIVTDSTNASDAMNGYFPAGYTFIDALRIRRADPHHYKNLSNHSMMVQVKSMLELQKRGSLVFEYGNKIREKAYNRGFDNAFAIPSFVPGYIYPVINSQNISFKWIALSGESEDIFMIDDMIVAEFGENRELSHLIDVVNKVIFHGSVHSRKCRLEAEEGLKLYKRINEMVRDEELKAPVLLGFSRFKGVENHGTIKGNYFLDRNLSFEEIFENIKNNPDGSSWLSLSYKGGSSSYYAMPEMMLVADGSKDAEQRITKIISQLS